MRQHVPSPAPGMEEVQRQFNDWRRTRQRRTRIPPRLWDAAVSLAGRYSLHKIAITLRLNHTQLRKRIARAASLPMPPVSFVEYPLLAAAPHKPQYLIEMQNRLGDKMTVLVTAGSSLDLASLGKAFWNRTP